MFNNMFPFWVLLSYFGIDGLNKILSMADNSAGSFTNFRMSEESLNVIKEFESFQPKAYKVPGETFFTIGYGSTKIYSADGKSWRSVVAGEVLTQQQALFQIRMYYNSTVSPKPEIDKIIKQYGVNINQRFYDMLLQIAYGSRSMHRKSQFIPVYVAMLKKAHNSTDMEMLGELAKNTWLAYLKAYANYSMYGLGWSRRAFAVAQYIKGKDYTMKTAIKNVKKAY